LLTLQGPAGVARAHGRCLLNRAGEQGAAGIFKFMPLLPCRNPFRLLSNFMRSLAGITSIDYNPQSHYQKFRRLLEELACSAAICSSLAALTGLRRVDFETTSAATVLDSLLQMTRVEIRACLRFVRGGKMRRKGSNLDVLERLERRAPVEAGQIWLPVSETTWCA